ncbi:site-2 protease family protein [Methylonatrum kenyense]|uniref:site-2 protease family protein n=1 Tax=Methylonatrum kenyense TaxID=455253 RepID=UPI0020BEA88F|nr:site-2 protease family protein [Methylonatrum kenyense]MCK8516349.1 site-2 protease family protein [Methylonatrum kenyense]
MFKTVLVLGHIIGIRIQIHVSWIFILILLLASLSAGFHHQYPDWTFSMVTGSAAVTALLFFSSILAHELGHSVVALRRGIPVESITLFILGGMAQMGRDAEQADDEFWIAIAGPAVSLALALMFGGLSWLTSGWFEPIPVALGWLGLINLIVAVFNLIPGFPLDGGRVFRALVWKFTGDARKAVEAAVRGGRMVAYLLFGFAFWNLLVVGNLIGGIWIMLIGWFLLTMAEGHGRMYDMRERLADVSARDLANPDVPFVSPDVSIDKWIHDDVLPGGRRSFLVGEPAQVQGLVSLSDSRKVPRERWKLTRVADIMTRSESLSHVSPDTGAEDILRLMTERKLNQIPVMERSGRAIGWIDRQQLLRTIDIHMELKR